MFKYLGTLSAVCAVAAFGTFAATPGASASTLVVSGDTTFFTDSDATNDNLQFVANVLGSGTEILYQGGASPFFNGNIPLLLGPLGTVSTLSFSDTITASALSGQDLFITARPADPFTAAETSAISDFLSGGGSVLLTGEYEPLGATGNGHINGLLAGLGSTMSILPGTALDAPGDAFAGITADALTTGVGVFAYGFASAVSGGTTLFTSELTGTGFISAQTFATTPPIPLPASLPLLLAGLGAVAMIKRRRRAQKA